MIKTTVKLCLNLPLGFLALVASDIVEVCEENEEQNESIKLWYNCFRYFMVGTINIMPGIDAHIMFVFTNLATYVAASNLNECRF